MSSLSAHAKNPPFKVTRLRNHSNSSLQTKPDFERAWAVEEIEVLKESYPKGGYASVTRRLPARSKGSVYSMAQKLNIKHRPNRAAVKFMDCETISTGLGISATLIAQWIASGKIESLKRGGSLVVTPAAMRRWLRDHPKSVNLANVDRAWFWSVAFP